MRWLIRGAAVLPGLCGMFLATTGTAADAIIAREEAVGFNSHFAPVQCGCRFLSFG
jgi:hypothetical protein